MYRLEVGRQKEWHKKQQKGNKQHLIINQAGDCQIV